MYEQDPQKKAGRVALVFACAVLSLPVVAQSPVAEVGDDAASAIRAVERARIPGDDGDAGRTLDSNT